MFYYISGTLAAVEPTFAVIDAGGVGYKLTISQTTHDSLPPHLSVSTPPTVKLYTYMSVREDGVELFGFWSYDELSAFKLLISVSGIGPKVALSVLSHYSPDKFAVIVANEDIKSLSKVSGVGQKTAARIVLELKDKISKEALVSSGTATTENVVLNTDSGTLSEAQDALVVLGYSRPEAISALKKVYSENIGLEELIRRALKEIGK